jgi:hypothetical protein
MNKKIIIGTILIAIVILFIIFFIKSERNTNEDRKQLPAQINLDEEINLIEQCKSYSSQALSQEELEQSEIPRLYWDCILLPNATLSDFLPSDRDIEKLKIINKQEIFSTENKANCEIVWQASFTFHPYGANFNEHYVMSIENCEDDYFYRYFHSWGPMPENKKSEFYSINLDEATIAELAS